VNDVNLWWYSPSVQGAAALIAVHPAGAAFRLVATDV
jgi:hypothetical protein